MFGIEKRCLNPEFYELIKEENGGNNTRRQDKGFFHKYYFCNILASILSVA